ncbi:peptidase [Coraliomargarita sinensis]|uniref:Peptidase n=1 Tax=Coraliomargarita sinensis TaxID=2174842 RepID=A0A317ZKD8_9BACT|nr:M20/M25/M40 family metallo-hydrolase [Coraliomargarita sinensis]PXA04279.1 peptidase [Coraliomargarita sinensis]
MATDLQSILDSIHPHRKELHSIRELLLANAMMIGEIPAPTGEEADRITFLANRYTEDGLQNISIDEAGNGMAVLPGKRGENNILVCAHADTVFSPNVDHAMSVTADKIFGPGIGDNSLGLAAIVTLPEILKRLKISFDDNLILLGCSRSLGRGDLGGIRFFLENNKLPIRAGISVEGIQLGRLSYSAIGMLRGEISVHMPSAYDWAKFGATGSVATLTKVVQRIMEIPIPMQPPTQIIFGSINGGTSFGTRPSSAKLRFEIRSEKAGMVAELKEKIIDIVEETANTSNAEIKFSSVAERQTGGLDYGHPMVKAMRKILETLEVKPRIEPSVGELSQLIDRGVPSVTLGLTRGENKNELDESIDIPPIFGGIAQMIALLESIDGGLCDEQ